MDVCLMIAPVVNDQYSALPKETCSHLIEAIGEVSYDEMINCIDKVIAWFAQNTDTDEIFVDVNTREATFSPPIEMTIEEIEKKLGHKVKIVENGHEVTCSTCDIPDLNCHEQCREVE